MRPPKLKTTLSVLRNRIFLGMEPRRERDSKTGNSYTVMRPKVLTKEQVAKWLKISVSAVEKIESGKLPLTKNNAEVISLNTGVSVDWLLGNKSKPIVDDDGRKFTQKTFEQTQEWLKTPAFQIWQSVFVLVYGVKNLAEITILACELGKIHSYWKKLHDTLFEIRESFPKEARVAEITSLMPEFKSGKVNNPSILPDFFSKFGVACEGSLNRIAEQLEQQDWDNRRNRGRVD